MITNSIQLVNTKIRVNSPEESIRIQKRAFDIGFFWPSSPANITQYTDKKFLVFLNTSISYINTEEGFNKIREEEITLHDIFGDEPPEETQQETPHESLQKMIDSFNELSAIAERLIREKEELEIENLRLNNDFSEEIKKHNALAKSATQLAKTLQAVKEYMSDSIEYTPETGRKAAYKIAYDKIDKTLKDYFYLIS